MKTSRPSALLLALVALAPALLVKTPALAQDYGNTYSNRSNATDGSDDSRDANSSKNSDSVSGQSFVGSNGEIMMEEVPDKPKPKPKPIPIDLSRVGVSVDPHGNIVPTKTDPDAPWAQSGVKPFYNHIESTTTVPYVYPAPYLGGAPIGVYPYGGAYPAFPGYPGYRNFGPPLGPLYPGMGGGLGLKGSLGVGLGMGLGALANNLLGYGYNPYGFGGFSGPGYPGYGFPAIAAPNFYPAYGYGSGFYNPLYPGYPGYMPMGLGYSTFGNSSDFISNDPVTGAPLPQESNSQTFHTSTSGTISPGLVIPYGSPFTTGPWLAPSTSFQQNSMWKAFNLAF